MTTALLLAVTLAAPVPPPNPKADRVRLEALWADLASYDPVARTKAAFALADHPAAVPFLKEKAPPVAASAKQVRGWLSDLNSDDEAVQKAAFDKLRYFDPQSELTPHEQLEHITTDTGRRLLASIWWGELIDPQPDVVRTTLVIDGHDSFTFVRHHLNRNGRLGVSDINGTLFGVSHLNSDDWRRAALAAVILDRIGTRASRELLLQLAGGHPDALPTRVAVAAIRGRFSLPSSLLDTSWAKVLEFDPIQTRPPGGRSSWPTARSGCGR